MWVHRGITTVVISWGAYTSTEFPGIFVPHSHSRSQMFTNDYIVWIKISFVFQVCGSRTKQSRVENWLLSYEPDECGQQT